MKMTDISDILLKPEWFPLNADEKGVRFSLPFRHPSTNIKGDYGDMPVLDSEVIDAVIEPALQRTYLDVQFLLKQAKKHKNVADFCRGNLEFYEQFYSSRKKREFPASDGLYVDVVKDPQVIKNWLKDSKARKRKPFFSTGFKLEWFPIQGTFEVRQKKPINVGIGVGDGVADLALSDRQTSLDYIDFPDKIMKEYGLEVVSNTVNKDIKYIQTNYHWERHNMMFMAKLYSRNFALEYNNEFLRKVRGGEK